MAAREIVNIKFMDVEPVVNRWLLEYYHSLALDMFQMERYKDFLDIRNVLDGVLVRPLEVTDTTLIRIQVMQFLSRVQDGERLGERSTNGTIIAHPGSFVKHVSFESDQISPLESALIVFERMNQEFNIPPQDFENVHTLLKEMMVSILIKNNEFGRAEEVLKKYFPKPMVGKKAIFMGLIKQKSKTHKVIEQINFRRFKEEMFAFCKRVCPVNIPFLHKAAKVCIDKRLEEPDDRSAGEEQDEPGTASNPQINPGGKSLTCECETISMSKLEATYTALAAGSDERTFAQLSNEVKTEEQAEEEFSLNLSPSPIMDTVRDSPQVCSFQRSGSPLEASLADQPPQMDAADPQTPAGSLSKTTSMPRKRRLYTMARLVLEPDSQASSQHTSASQEPETGVRSEEPPQATAVPNKMDLQNPVTDIEIATPKRKQPRQARKIDSSDSSSLPEFEEDPPGTVADGETCMGNVHKQSNSSLSGKSMDKELSDSEEEPQETPTPSKNPVQKPHKRLARDRLSKVPENQDEVCINDSSLDSSPSLFVHRVPQTSSTPHKKSAQDRRSSHSKWKQLLSDAKESRETWSGDESHTTSKNSRNESTVSNSGHRKRKWTEHETQQLREGVKEFGEGNWNKIMTRYSFNDRTNVHLKDRWRTMKKLKMV